MAVPTGTLVLSTTEETGLLTPTHYVSPDGNDTLTQATYNAAASSGSPCTPRVAMAYATEDDVVQFETGRYTLTGSGVRYMPALNPTYSGSSGHPITFQHDGGTVDFEFSSGTGPVLGAYRRDYITWHGFTVDEALCPRASDSGPIVIWGDSTGCV